MNALAKIDVPTPILIVTGKIQPSPTNPRKTFDKKALAELADSVRAHGLQSPPKVRPAGGDPKNGYELVIGERRWRAFQLLGIPEIPCFIEDLDDAEVLEIQIIENGQREDVPPLEEAEGYALLMKQPGYTMDRLVERTGKSRAHLYGRIKIATDLVPRAKKALAAGELSASVAELLARLPDKKIQDLATREVLGEALPHDTEYPNEDGEDGVEPEKVIENPEAAWGDRKTTIVALSFRAAQALLHRRYSLRLDQAKFDTSDVELVKGAGACGDCAFRSGNQPDLFGALTNPADVCTNPPCFAKKTAATFKIAVAFAKAAKREVLEGKAAEALFESHGGRLKWNGDYVDPDEDLPYDLRKGSSSSAPSWRKLLGAKHEVPVTLVQDPRTGAPLELLKKSDAVAALRAAGKIDKPTKPTPAERAEKAKAKAKLDVKAGAFTRILGDVAERAAAIDVGGGDKKLVPALRLIARYVAENSVYAGDRIVTERRELPGGGDPSSKLEKVLDRAKGGELLGLIFELIVAGHEDYIVRSVSAGSSGAKVQTAMFADICELLGADWAKAQELAKAAIAAEAKSDTAKAKKGSSK